MKEEILAAVMFLVRFIEKSETFPRDQLENFKNNLTTLLTQRFEKHWFPEVPAKGQGYRCIRVNGLSPVDMTLEKAAVQCGLRYRDLRLPTELTVWVDPSEVCYRLGESEGSYCTLASFPSDSLSPTSNHHHNNHLSIEKSKKQIRNHHHHRLPPYELTKFQRNMLSTSSASSSPYTTSTSTSTNSTSLSLNNNNNSNNNNNNININNTTASAAAAIRMRQMAFNIAAPNRPHPQWRCDRQSYHPVPPSSYHHYGAANRYMQRNYKNVLTV